MAILKIIRSKTKGTKMGEAGYQYVKTHYSWQKMAKSTYTVYRDALALSVQSKTAVRSGAYKTAAV